MVTLSVSILHVPFDALLDLVEGSLELTDNLPEASRVLLGPGPAAGRRPRRMPFVLLIAESRTFQG